MSVRDLFEKKYADAIENLSDDVLEIFDYLLEKCDEIEYTRDIQRKRICELERENNVLKIFLSDSESIEENSDELGDILADADALCEKLALLAEMSSIADSLSTRCKTLRASTDKLQKQREECELSLGVGAQAPREYEEGTYLADDTGRNSNTVRDDEAENDPTSACDGTIDDDTADDESDPPAPDVEDIAALLRTQEKTETSAQVEETSCRAEEIIKPAARDVSKTASDDDEISDLTSRLKSMLDEGDVKAAKKSSDDDGYSDLVKLFFTEEN